MVNTDLHRSLEVVLYAALLLKVVINANNDERSAAPSAAEFESQLGLH